MNGESPANGGASPSGLNAGNHSSGEVGHGEALTVKQRRRFPAVTVDGILARPASTAQAHDLGLALGKVMRSDRTFEPLRGADDMLCVEIRPTHREKVLDLLELSSWSWGEYVRQWEAVGLAHRCEDLKRGAVRLFPRPENVCPVCGVNVAGSNTERGSEQRSTLPRATENVLKPGDASGDEKGVAQAQAVAKAAVQEASKTPQEGSSEIAPPSDEAALANLRRFLGATPIGNPLSDDEIRQLGFEPTRRGWVPRKAATDAS